jgi:4,5-dihydroxyphthalate decarboxylase
VDLLREGALDAIFTPFMPNGYFEPGSPFRQVLRDFRSEEQRYFDDVGYVPGMHLIGIKAEVVAENPWVIAEISRLVDESQKMWTEKRPSMPKPRRGCSTRCSKPLATFLKGGPPAALQQTAR